MSEQPSLLDRAAELVLEAVDPDRPETERHPSYQELFELLEYWHEERALVGEQLVGELVKAIDQLRKDIVTYKNHFQTGAWTDHLSIGIWALERIQDRIDEIFGERKA